jgi:hypothetical protein
MDMSNSMAELVDPEIYDPISQRPETMAEFAELIKQTTARCKRPGMNSTRESGRRAERRFPSVIVGYCIAYLPVGITPAPLVPARQG